MKTPKTKKVKPAFAPVAERKFFVLREVEVEAESLKEGDVFRIQPANDADYKNINPRELFIMKEDAKQVPHPHGSGQLNLTITAAPVAIVEHESFVALKQLGKWNLDKIKSAVKQSGGALVPAEVIKQAKKTKKKASKKK